MANWFKKIRRRIWKANIKRQRYLQRGKIRLRGCEKHNRAIRSECSKLLAQAPVKIQLYGFSDILEDIPLLKDIQLVEPGWFSLESDDRPDVDLILVKSSGWRESVLYAAKQKSPQSLRAVWMYDNHHSLKASRHLAAAADVFFPAHEYCAHWLDNLYSINAGALPVACELWSRSQAIKLFQKYRSVVPRDALYGGFCDYPGLGDKRTALLRSCMGAFPESALGLYPADCAPFLKQKAAERFLERRQYKVSLTLPLINDLGCRVFDALVVGQIPIVPRDVYDFEQIIPQQIQEQLSIVRLDDYTVEGVKQAHIEALRAYDREGLDGALRRHLYAVNKHMEIHRLEEMIRRIKILGKESQSDIREDHEAGN